jgi:putative transposase
LKKAPEEILMPGKARDRILARSLFCFWATRELGKTMTELAVQMGMTVAGVSISVSRGEKIIKEKMLDLKDILKL